MAKKTSVQPAVEQPRQAWGAAEFLAEMFPTVPIEDIVQVLIDVRRAADLFGLGHDEQRQLTEKLAIEALRQRAGIQGASEPT